MPFAGRRRPAQILRLASTVARQIIVALTNRKIERRDFVLVLKLNATRIDTLVVEACPPNIKQLAVEFWMSGYVRSPWSCDSEAPVPRAARAASPVSPRLSRPSHESSRCSRGRACRRDRGAAPGRVRIPRSAREPVGADLVPDHDAQRDAGVRLRQVVLRASEIRRR